MSYVQSTTIRAAALLWSTTASLAASVPTAEPVPATGTIWLWTAVSSAVCAAIWSTGSAGDGAKRLADNITALYFPGGLWYSPFLHRPHYHRHHSTADAGRLWRLGAHRSDYHCHR